ncbi:GNAT family N-acetyltransferase [Neobacillus vireti]|uniref:GCN5-like N-acetyltransferase n=1 Tax=Neobacillus vireti LMG 21834 TaxID=1131730 RepID=A0AB94IS75_9BACI|nr:GNAT family N-acetyltransferase [Neobacillus vireti]ETI69827.1 GCN5-like N-acetyltransferase [Neobacillus vireti LMG 21834]KLT17824.1 GCN5 family acetyltransferase [Neobacillus vireti]
MKYRKATIDDIDKLVELRKKQLVDERIEPNIDIDRELYVFFKNKLSDGTLIQWVVEDNQEIIACGAVIFYEFPPSYTNKTGKKAYIANMYTNENYRGQGIASKLLTKLVDEVKLAGVSKIWLGASKMGRPVYKKFGFTETDEFLEFSFS